MNSCFCNCMVNSLLGFLDSQPLSVHFLSLTLLLSHSFPNNTTSKNSWTHLKMIIDTVFWVMSTNLQQMKERIKR